jgi:hypothetical protein
MHWSAHPRTEDACFHRIVRLALAGAPVCLCCRLTGGRAAGTANPETERPFEARNRAGAFYKRPLLHLTRGPDRPRNLEALPGSGGTCRGRYSVWHQAVVPLR